MKSFCSAGQEKRVKKKKKVIIILLKIWGFNWPHFFKTGKDVPAINRLLKIILNMEKY